MYWDAGGEAWGLRSRPVRGDWTRARELARVRVHVRGGPQGAGPSQGRGSVCQENPGQRRDSEGGEDPGGPWRRGSKRGRGSGRGAPLGRGSEGGSADAIALLPGGRGLVGRAASRLISWPSPVRFSGPASGPSPAWSPPRPPPSPRRRARPAGRGSGDEEAAAAARGDYARQLRRRGARSAARPTGWLSRPARRAARGLRTPGRPRARSTR